MIDIRILKQDTQRIKDAMIRRGADNLLEKIDRICALDDKRKSIIAKSQELETTRNAVTKKIPLMKKAGEDTAELFADMKQIGEQIKQLNGECSVIEKEIREGLYELPNIPSDKVPTGADDSDNIEIRRFSDPAVFDFKPKPHWELGAQLGILDPESAAKVTGARFHFYKGLGARLERAIFNFFLDTHAKAGYTEIFPPFMVNRAAMTGTGQLPKFEEDAFKLKNEDYFLIPTAEVPVTNMHRDEILKGDCLPLNYCAYSACFRAEAGSAGRDTRGLIRQHQFNKVELVKFASPDDSYAQLEKLTADAENVLKLLNLPYRVVLLCSGDMGFSSAMTYDIEVWMPSYERYVEISSCSNFEDFQARRASIKFKSDPAAKAQFLHTLNGSGVAVGRTTAAILENYQQADGSVLVPDVLVPYMGVTKIIKDS